MKIMFIILTMTLSALASSANSSTNTGTCSGYLNNYGSFTVTTTQTATFVNGKMFTEIHVFIFMGFFEDLENAKALAGNETHVLYENAKYQIAVPYVPKAGLYFRDKNSIDFPRNRQPSAWVKLCDY